MGAKLFGIKREQAMLYIVVKLIPWGIRRSV